MDPFIGQIIMFAGTFAPRGWALCNGQLLSINDNTTLFSILGTTYGGDGRSTFALPDLRGRAPIHAGSGPNLTRRTLGQKGGEEAVQIKVNEMPSHNHGGTVKATNEGQDHDEPEGSYLAAGDFYKQTPATTADMHSDMLNITDTGGNAAHDNMQPFLTVNYIIALSGTYPSRS